MVEQFHHSDKDKQILKAAVEQVNGLLFRSVATILTVAAQETDLTHNQAGSFAAAVFIEKAAYALLSTSMITSSEVTRTEMQSMVYEALKSLVNNVSSVAIRLNKEQNPEMN